MKASEIEGAAITGGDTLDLGDIFGKEIAVLRLVRRVEKDDGTMSLIVASHPLTDSEPDSEITHWISGRLARVFDRLFQTTEAKDIRNQGGFEGVFWLNPTLADGTKYNGWTFLDTDVTPVEWETPKKILQRLAQEQALKQQQNQTQARLGVAGAR